MSNQSPYGNLSDDDRRLLNDLLSKTTMSSVGGEVRIDGENYQPLSNVLRPQQQLQQTMPENFIRNESTGKVTTFDSPTAHGRPNYTLDYSQPVTNAWGEGFRVKGSPFLVVNRDGRIVKEGVENDAQAYEREKRNLSLENTRLQNANLRAHGAAVKKPDENWEKLESGGKIYLINSKTGAMKPAEVGGQHLEGKPAKVDKKLDPLARVEGAMTALATAGYDTNTQTDKVEELIRQSTSGGAQKLGAAAARFFDVTTEGGKAIQALKTISNSITLDLLNGKLGAGISNADVKFLEGTLGEMANEDLTADERLAAWKQARSRILSFANPSNEAKATPTQQSSKYVDIRQTSAGLVGKKADGTLELIR